MSDPCAIGVLKKDGQAVSIRARSGGLSEHAGLVLVQSWNGDRLWLADNIEAGRAGALRRNKSRPFAKPETGKIAVKVINHYGDEVTKTFSIT